MHNCSRRQRFLVLIASVLTLSILAQPARATVDFEGDVLMREPGGGAFIGDNPFVANDFIPGPGNIIDPARDPALGFEQITYEGRASNNNTPANPNDDFNINFDIYVGRSSFGEMVISGRSDLRDMNLIIGDSAVIGGVPRRGTGIVRIDGFSSSFNNDPRIIPYLGPILTPDPDNPTSPSVNPRDDEPGFEEGFDLYVGRAGNGVLQLSAGGRAEIHDAAIVGNDSGSVGTVLIDGVDSFLQSGGLLVDTGGPSDEVHYMIIGRLGSATMNITNGGQSFNIGPLSATGGDAIFGAVIGSNLAAEDTTAPSTGGQGTVWVDGTASKWTIAGNLQVGGFHDSRDGDTPGGPIDLDGLDAAYANGVGRGTLHINNNALVSVVLPPVVDPTDPSAETPDELDLLIGRFGRVEMDGGRFELLGAFSSTDPNNPTQELTRGRIVNDGVISGDGSMSALQFRNRVQGEVRVGAGQKLLIEATGTYTEIDNIPLPDEQEYPLSNYGLIEIVGTDTARAEIEFDRNVVTVPTATDFTRPFLNLPVPLPFGPNGRTGGEILAQNGTLRFRSDIINRHKVSFTGGTNLVSGNFFNEGTVFVAGNNTSVTFIDEFINSGVLQLEPNISLVMFIDNVTFLGGGSLSTSFGGRPTGQEISMISSAEDLFLGGALNASLFTAPGVPGFSPQPGDQFEIISTAGDLVGDFATVNLPGCIGVLCFVGFPDYTLDSYFIRAFSIAAAVGADFNGDGIVDDLDLQIWRQNVGGPGPVGDANGDGIVNGQDLFLWQMQLGGPGVPGAGSGGGGLASNSIPEPASVVLLVGGLLALAVRRRRTA